MKGLRLRLLKLLAGDDFLVLDAGKGYPTTIAYSANDSSNAGSYSFVWRQK